MGSNCWKKDEEMIIGKTRFRLHKVNASETIAKTAPGGDVNAGERQLSDEKTEKSTNREGDE